MNPGTAFDDYPVQELNGPYWPKTSPPRYRGFVSVATGIQNSINTIALQTLQACGVAEAYAFATEKLCLSLEPEDMDLSPCLFHLFTDSGNLIFPGFSRIFHIKKINRLLRHLGAVCPYLSCQVILTL